MKALATEKILRFENSCFVLDEVGQNWQVRVILKKYLRVASRPLLGKWKCPPTHCVIHRKPQWSPLDLLTFFIQQIPNEYLHYVRHSPSLLEHMGGHSKVPCPGVAYILEDGRCQQWMCSIRPRGSTIGKEREPREGGWEQRVGTRVEAGI